MDSGYNPNAELEVLCFSMLYTRKHIPNKKNSNTDTVSKYNKRLRQCKNNDIT